MCHRKVMQMQYSRTRSRSNVSNYRTLKFGDVADTTSDTYDFRGPLEGFANGGQPQSNYQDGGPISMSASGVATYYAGSRYWFSESGLLDRTKSYQTALLDALLSSMQTRRYNLLSGTSAPYLVMDSGQTLTDVVTTDYKERSAKGEIISSPMSGVSYTSVSSPIAGGSGYTTPTVIWSDLGRVLTAGNQSYQSRHRMEVQFGAHFSAFGVPSNVLSILLNDLLVGYIDGSNAISSSHGNVYQAEADLALFIAEAEKTFSHLASTAMKIASIVKKIKSGNFADLAPKAFALWKKSKAQGLASASNVFLDAWLEARYAWRPLWLDAEDAIKYLNKTASSTRRTFRAYDGEQSTASDYELQTTSNGYSYRFYGSVMTDRSCRAGVLTEIVPDFGERRALGLANPLGLAWELVPYSFVVDWFVNVSGFIAATNPNSWFKILTSWASYTSEVSFTGYVDITNLTTSESKTVQIALSQKERKRDIDTQPDYINFDVNLDIFKLVDSVALLRRFKH
nr:MAG: hypothetical protein 1 [Leviviridae sp.]